MNTNNTQLSNLATEIVFVKTAAASATSQEFFLFSYRPSLHSNWSEVTCPEWSIDFWIAVG